MDYAALAATAARLLAQYGQPVTLRNYPVGTYSTANSTVSGMEPTDVTRNGALFDFGEGQTIGPGGLIQQGDKKLLMEAGVVPALEDHVIVAGVEYVIKGISGANPAGVPVAYTLHLRT